MNETERNETSERMNERWTDRVHERTTNDERMEERNEIKRHNIRNQTNGRTERTKN